MFIPLELAFVSSGRGRRRPGRDASGRIEKQSCHQALIGSEAWPNEPQTCGLLAKISIVAWSSSATFIRVGMCANTRQKTNERIPGWFRAGDRDLGIFAQDELKGRSSNPGCGLLLRERE
jgi:hypothetical protein